MNVEVGMNDSRFDPSFLRILLIKTGISSLAGPSWNTGKCKRIS